MSRHLKKLVLFLYSSALALNVAAQTPTPQQIEQFQRLPKAQQERIARQMGIDLSQLSGMGQNSTNSTFNDTVQPTYPRGTKFDEFGNPILDEEQEDANLEEEEDELKLYGSEIFANEPITFTPLSNVSVPADYLLGPGDELGIQIYGKNNEEYMLQVDHQGQIVIPTLGPISVASLTFSEAKRVIQANIREKIIGVEANVTMGQLRSLRVLVMGEAYKPGTYTLSSLSTMTHALFASGGVNDIASLRNIQLKRAGKLVSSLDLYDLLNNGDASDDAVLQDGDVVFIPTIAKTVTVDGLVRRPAIYELKGEKSLSEVIDLAGGKQSEGFLNAVSVKRFVDGAQMQLTADVTREDLVIHDGDYITVPKVSPYVQNSVSLIGAFARPGKYQWKDGVRLSDIVSDPSRELLEQADLSYVLIIREINSNKDIEVYQTDFLSVLRGSDKDMLLHRNDKVLVFSKIESEVLGDISLESMAYTEEELVEFEKQEWQKRIEERLFWKSVGLDIGPEQESALDEIEELQSQSIINLTESEQERVLEFKDTTYFSRKRMLAPVIAKLREQAKYGEPIKLVEIAGEVKVPGNYPLTEGATVANLITAAGGLTESSYPLNSEITRISVDAEGMAQVNHISFSPFDVMNGDGKGNTQLRSKDRINIFSTPSWQEELKVMVKGEVQFPGEYTIRRGERLTDLVERVGGITSYGDPQAAVFTRESLKQKEKDNLRGLAEELRKQIASESLRKQSGAGAIVSYEEAKKLLRDLTKAEAIGRLVIDLNSILAKQSDIDIILEDGDALYIPSTSQSVNVIGEVYVPTSHVFEANLDFEDYILRSGGYRALADKGSTYIIRANGSVDVPNRESGFWFNSGEKVSVIRPGDTIVVPFDADNVDNMTLWASATQIVYQLAVAVAAIGSL